MSDTKQIIKAGEEKMTFAIEYLDEQLSHIRAGKANPKILDCVKVMYNGAPVPLTNVATVTVPDAGAYSPFISLASVDFPEPLRPRMA